MDYLKLHYGSNYAPNTRETFRRQVLHKFVHAGIADYNPFDPKLPTNSPKAHYAITPAALKAVQCYATENWENAVNCFFMKKDSLIDRYADQRHYEMIPVTLDSGQDILLSAGRHNELQRTVIKDFIPRFAPGAQLLYLGDTAKKNLYVDKPRLTEFNIVITGHDKLPDLVFYDTLREWLILVEAVTSHGPVSPSRKIDLENMLSDCPLRRVYVSAFPDFKEFRHQLTEIAWESADHLIHFDGERLTP